MMVGEHRVSEYEPYVDMNNCGLTWGPWRIPSGVDEPEDTGVLSGRSGRMDSVTVLTKHGSSSRSTLGSTVEGGFRGL